MPRSGGIYTLPPGYFAVDGTTIEVSQHNPPFEDVAQALTDSLPRDGSAPMTGNLAMGSNKITGLAAATNPADAVRFDQLPTFTPTTGTLTAGTDAQGQGPITTDQVTITVAAANPSGATLPTAVAGDRVIIANRGANPVNIYPATGAAIGALATNAPVLLAVNQSVEFFARSATQWEGQISQPLDDDLTQIAGLTRNRGDLIVGGASAWQDLALGTNGQVAKSNGTDLIYGGPRQVSSVATTTSGTFFDFTGVPTTALFFTLHCHQVSLSGTNGLLVRLLDAGGSPITSGYLAVSATIDGSTPGTGNDTTGFTIFQSNALENFTGRMNFARVPGTNLWVQDHTGRRATSRAVFGGGNIDALGGVTGIRLLATGADTFDQGSAWISWEAA